MALKHLSSLLAGVGAVSALVSAPPFGALQQKPLLPQRGGGSGSADFSCELPPLLAPSGDGLPSSESLFSSHEALLTQVKRHQAIVRVPSVSYDDLGSFETDKRWAPFYTLHKTLRQLYPTIYNRAQIDHVNTFGLVYTLAGSDASLKPLLLAAHQDVVPVADESTWTYPPFEAYFDGEWLWGRGASDDKNSLTALMSALETLLSQPGWAPRRTIIVALGFDEECGGPLGAGEISKFLEERHGRDGIAAIFDEGGMGMQRLGDTLYVLPSVVEKGNVEIFAALHTAGGHASIPFPHTGIGIAAELVTALEARPYTPQIIRGSPVYNHLVCVAKHSPGEAPEIARLLAAGDLDELTAAFIKTDTRAPYLVATSQAIDLIAGGQKINAMPEVVTIGVDYRVAPQDSVPKVQHTFVNNVAEVVAKYNLTVKAFVGDKKYEEYVANLADAAAAAAAAVVVGSSDEAVDEAVDYKGVLVLTTAASSSPVTPVSPTTGPVWDVFSGTLQHAFALDGVKVVPAGEIMNGNTDTRHYLNLSRHIYRFSPTWERGNENIHTVDERVRMTTHLDAVKFYYDLVRNYDASKA